MQEIKNNPQVYTTQESKEEILPKKVKDRLKVIFRYTLPQEGVEEIKSNPKVNTTQEGMQEIKK